MLPRKACIDVPDALLSPDVALEQITDDWIDTYRSSKGKPAAEKAAVQELVLFFIRACGLSADVDEDESMDQDGVGDTIERIQDESVKVGTPPKRLLTSRPMPRPTL